MHTRSVFSIPVNAAYLRVQNLAIREQMPASVVHRPAGTEEYLFAFFYTDAVFRGAGGDIAVPPNSLVIWRPGDPQEYGSLQACWSYSWVLLAGHFIFDLLERVHLPCQQMITLPSPAPVEGFLTNLLLELQEDEADIVTIENLLTNWFRGLQRVIRRESLPHPLIPDEYQALKRYLDAHYDAPISLATLAAQACVSLEIMQESFKRYFGMAPIEYLLQLRLPQAVDLLRDCNLTIAEVARRVGYDDLHAFSQAFRTHYGADPGDYRQELLDSERIRRNIDAERRAWELDRLLRDGWHPVLDCDFSVNASVDPRLHPYIFSDVDIAQIEQEPAPELVTLVHGALRLDPCQLWVNLRWEATISEESMVEVAYANTASEGLNAGIAISGDACSGYRLRLSNYDHVQFETISRGQWEVLADCAVTLDPRAAEYCVTLWRAGTTFYADIDGQRVLEFNDPLPPHGSLHQQFALYRGPGRGSSDIRRLRVFTHREPHNLDVLEQGRILLRDGYQANAAEWFRHVATTALDVDIQREARYLLAMSLPEFPQQEKDAALCAIADDPQHPSRAFALRELAFLRFNNANITGAVDAVVLLAHLQPDSTTPGMLALRMCGALARPEQEEPPRLLAEIRRLPVTRLVIRDTPLTSLAPLRGMPLQYLTCTDCAVEDLSPLRDMPLAHLNCDSNVIYDLSPVTGMPLRLLYCPNNSIADLSPLRGMKLQTLAVWANLITDLSPLGGLPLQSLECSLNNIEELAALADMPLRILICDFNHLRDLSPLRGGQLQELNCAHNRIHDLAPLRGLPIETLYCGENPIDDFSPLAEMPLSDLSIHHIALSEENADVIARLPLRHLQCNLTPVSRRLLADMPSLRLFNHHRLAYVLPIAEALYAALQEYQTQPRHEHMAGTPLSRQADLRRFATLIGDIAYLAIPIPLSHSAAMDFAALQRGRLCCPSTKEAYLQLHRYLRPLLERDTPAEYHLGLLRNPCDGAPYWQSGAPYQWHYWSKLSDAPHFHSSIAEASFTAMYNPHIPNWKCKHYSNEPSYFVIEWERDMLTGN